MEVADREIFEINTNAEIQAKEADREIQMTG